MKVFRISESDGSFPSFYTGGLTDAKRAVKSMVPKALRASTDVDELEVPTHKEGVLAMLSGSSVGVPTGLSYTVTARGALEKLP